ncbi:MAG TPA: tRNA (adenosine(37)-N6)-threonylcarbamoyltransferase complex transferase subunit TsaD [Firmicutes bacterium]|nr:tRNA (adenosine(37)-N6)-threonylcarbamoyltransferase complex transferase subunit TsaD [Bacillota bacterium]
MLVLGIETSCDDTSAGVVKDGRTVLSNLLASQVDVHSKYGGVVPEIASRKHLEASVPVIDEALMRAGISLQDVDAISVTMGPGLLGALLVGVCMAKALAFAGGKRLVGIHHLEGHIYANFLTDEPPAFPFLALVVSGGHTDLIKVTGHGEYEVVGVTRDDAAGEAFDKVARALGLGYPGGPELEKLAARGDAASVRFPKPRLDGSGGRFDFSFSGLKTAVLRKLAVGDCSKEDIAAAFQRAVVSSLVETTLEAAEATRTGRVALAGGVAANSALRACMEEACRERGISLFVPPKSLCTDNGAMVAAGGHYALLSGRSSGLELNAVADLPFGP